MVLSIASQQLDPRLVATASTELPPAVTEQRLKNFEKTIKAKAVNEAIMDTAVGVAFLFAGPIGAVIGLVYSAVSMVNEHRAKIELRKQQQKAKELDTMVQIYVKQKEKEFNDLINSVYRRAYKEGADLALSWQPLDIKDEKESMQEVFNPEYHTGFKGLGLFASAAFSAAEGISRMSAQSAVQQISQINMQLQPLIDKIKQPAFQAYLAKLIAINMRNNPEFMSLAAKRGVPPPSHIMSASEIEKLPDTSQATPLPGPTTNGLPSPQARPIQSTAATPLISPGYDKIPSQSDTQRFDSSKVAVPSKKTSLLPLILGGGALAVFLMR